MYLFLTQFHVLSVVHLCKSPSLTILVPFLHKFNFLVENYLGESNQITPHRHLLYCYLHHVHRETWPESSAHTLVSTMWVIGVPGWLSQLSVWLWLRSWSQYSWVQAPHQARCCQCRACFGSSVPLSLCPSLPRALAPSLNKHFLKTYIIMKQN